MIQLELKLFRAIENLSLCEKFLEGHLNVLKVYGVTQVTTANNDWFFNPNVYVILVLKPDGSAHGGVRIHVANEAFKLPFEEATEHIDKNVCDYIHNLANAGGTGELCGLWNSKEIGGMGIGTTFLMRAGIALTCKVIPIATLLALCAQHTYNICIEKGFESILELGDKGVFIYPKDDLIASAVIIKEPLILKNATNIEREYIFKLRNDLKMTSLEETPKGVIQLNYNLVL
jgi:hypothetical protein